MIGRVREAVGSLPIRVHFHNTRNTGLANVWAAVTAGAATVDASLGGLGGCPFAPGAAGNVPTEDVAYLLERSGVTTGLDLFSAVEAAGRSEEHTSELQSLMRLSYAVFCMKKRKKKKRRAKS